ncbi:hypothetical protein CPB86DRAFT_788589, partial [Serendipita vermifera]
MSNDTGVSTIILSPAAQFFVDHASVTIAPWVMGALADLFLQGILTVQVTNYFTFQYDGSRREMWLVIVLAVLCVIKSVLNIANAWDIVIRSFCNPDAVAPMLLSQWNHISTGLWTALIAIIVQAFFVYRYWRFSRHWHVCAAIMLGMILSFVASIMIVVSFANSAHPEEDGFSPSTLWSSAGSLRTWVLLHFISAIVVDVTITALSAWRIHSQPARVTKSDSETTDYTIRMVWETALPATVCVIVNTAMIEAGSLQYAHVALNAVLPKLYAISLMYTLNLSYKVRAGRSRAASNGVSVTPPTYVARVSYHTAFVTDSVKGDLKESRLPS